MKAIKSIAIVGGLFLTMNAQSQNEITVTDDFSWASNSPQTSQTSPNFEFCQESSVNYTVSTPDLGNFGNVNGLTNNPYPHGIIFPADVADGDKHIQIDITFSQPVNNLSLHIKDLDGGSTSTGTQTQTTVNGEVINVPSSLPPDAETISNITPSYSDLTSTAQTIFDPLDGTVLEGTKIYANVNNAAGWIHWEEDGITAISITYNRPGINYGLILDGIEFSCSDEPTNELCRCFSDVSSVSYGTTSSDGTQTAQLDIESGKSLISKLVIEMPSYVSNVAEECLVCDVYELHLNGTITSASSIAGVAPSFYGNSGSNQSRKIVYDFPLPISIDQLVNVDLQFPAVGHPSCINSASYCLDVTLYEGECTVCEYAFCSDDVIDEEKMVVTNEPTEDVNDKISLSEIHGLEISPNPASDFINVNIVDESLVGKELFITNSAGAQVSSEKLQESSNRINVSKLPSGVYYLSVNAVDKTTSFKVIIN